MSRETLEAKERTSRLLKNLTLDSIWVGHDFSRAVKFLETNRALAPEVHVRQLK